MRERKLSALIVGVVALVTAACSSSTVIDGEAAIAINDDGAETRAAIETPTSEPTAAATTTPPTTEPAPSADTTDEPNGDRTLDLDAREAQLDSLAELCRGNDMRACDVLFLISPVGSDQEELGSTCGDAGIPETGWCTNGVQTGVNGLSFDESSPGINAVATACGDGDMMACDFLYFGSPGGGEWEAFGDGCGGRTDSAFPDCRTEFADS